MEGDNTRRVPKAKSPQPVFHAKVDLGMGTSASTAERGINTSDKINIQVVFHWKDPTGNPPGTGDQVLHFTGISQISGC